jgi:hypothetical protein
MVMKKLILVCIVVVSCSLSWGQQEFRTFTDATGRSIRAYIVSYDARKEIVSVKMEKGRTGKIPLRQLSGEDQKYVLLWVQFKDFLDEQRFKVSGDRKRTKEKGGSSGGTTLDVENVWYELTIENRSDVTFEHVTVDYCIFYEQEAGGTEEGVYCGTLKDVQFGATSKMVLATEHVKVYKSQLSDNYYYVDGSNSTQDGKVIGVWARFSLELSKGIKEHRDFCLPDTVSSKYRWTSTSKHIGLNK